jgi:hypothetical protein
MQAATLCPKIKGTALRATINGEVAIATLGGGILQDVSKRDRLICMSELPHHVSEDVKIP